MEGHILWQWMTHTLYFGLTIIGSVIVLGLVVRERRRTKNKR
jgi:hypothetical protein